MSTVDGSDYDCLLDVRLHDRRRFRGCARLRSGSQWTRNESEPRCGKRSTVQIRLATCTLLPEPDADRAPLAAAFERAGIEAQWLAWDDPTVDWETSLPTIVRSTWNYHQHRAAFLRWCERVAWRSPFWNPPDVIRMNTHKSYLLELARRGVQTVPTHLITQSSAAPRVADLAWKRVVVKPAVAASSVGAVEFRGDDPGADAHVAELQGHGDVLVQPFMESIHHEGEHSLIWIDGALTHQIRKAPRFAGQPENVTGPHPIEADVKRLALAALGPLQDRILYGRIDVVRGPNGEPLIMELELTEPSLFFEFGPGSADRYVSGVRRRLAGGSRKAR